MLVSFVIPCYNESRRIGKSLDKLLEYFSAFPYNYEIIFVNDGSTDDTSDIINKYIYNWKEAKLFYYYQNKGKGNAIKEGIKGSIGNPVFFMDADLSTDLSHIKEFLIYKDIDLVIGSRIGPHVNRIWYRKLLTYGASRFSRNIIGLPIKDTQCGFKMLNKKAQNIAISCYSKSREFDIELLYLAHKQQLNIKEIPIIWNEEKFSHINIRAYISTLVNSLYFLYKTRKN